MVSGFGQIIGNTAEHRIEGKVKLICVVEILNIVRWKIGKQFQINFNTFKTVKRLIIVNNCHCV